MQDNKHKPSQQVKWLTTLCREVFKMAGVEYLSLDRSALNTLVLMIEETCGIGTSYDSLRRLIEVCQRNELFSEKGFKQNEVKEVLAAFWLIKKNHLTKEDIKPSRSFRIGQRHKLPHIYFNLYLLKSKETPKNKETFTIFSFLGDIHEVPASFRNTYWHCFHLIQETQVINRHVIHISNQVEGQLTRCKLFNANSGYENYTGAVCLDFSRSFLLFYLATEESRSKHLHIKLKIPQGVRPSLIIGQDSIIGSKTNAVNSEILVLTNIQQPEPNIEKELKSFPLLSEGKYEEELPSSVGDYLLLMKEKELHSPSENINTLEALDIWLRRNNTTTMDHGLASYCGKYWVYYQYTDDHDVNKIDEIELSLFKDTHRQCILGNLVINERETYENAPIIRNNHFITASFNLKQANTLNMNTIFLQIQVGGEFIENEMECFVATISGLSDKQESAVSYLALVIPQSISNFYRTQDPKIEIFFKDQQHTCIETFRPKGFKLNNLSRMRGIE